MEYGGLEIKFGSCSGRLRFLTSVSMLAYLLVCTAANAMDASDPEKAREQALCN